MTLTTDSTTAGLPTAASAARGASAPTTQDAIDKLASWFGDLVMSGAPGVTDKLYNYIAPNNVAKLGAHMRRLERVRAMNVSGKKKKGQHARVIGMLFERLIKALVADSQALRFVGNVRTTTSEIDVVLAVQPAGAFVPMLRDAGNHIIGEAKCYTKGPKSEWVNEMRGTLATHGATVGILFLACTTRALASDIRYTIALHAAQGIKIVPFGMKQLNEVHGGANFLSVLSSQYTLAAVHSSNMHI